MFNIYCTYGSAHTSLVLIILSLLEYYLLQGWVLQGLGEFRLGQVRLEAQSARFVSFFYFIHHTAYTIDTCTLTSILPSLSLMDMIYCTMDTKAMLPLVQGVAVDWLIWISLLQTVWNEFIIELCDLVVFSVVQTVMEFERIVWVQVSLGRKYSW